MTTIIYTSGVIIFYFILFFFSVEHCQAINICYFFAGCILCIQIPFWTVGGMFMFMDYFNWPKWVRKYKVQPGTNEPVDLNKLKEVRQMNFKKHPFNCIKILISYILFAADN